MKEVVLIGAWPSPFSYKVIWTLKLKGIKYKYVEEDLSNKSLLLLQNNPVYKKIPVLVTGGKPIAESTVILECIEEKWPENTFLPKDSYERSVARFWAKFAEDKGIAIWKLFRSVGEEQEKAVEECLKMLRTIEEYGLEEHKFFRGDTIRLVDLALGSIIYWLRVIEDVVGVRLLEPHTFPHLFSWMYNFQQIPVIQDNLPGHDEMLVYFKRQRKIILASQ